MIVISGALVLVALVLLIFGITTTDLDFVYASIVVSLVSFVFLLIGILQRRGDKGAGATAAATSQPADEGPPASERDEGDEGATAVTPRVRQRVPAGGSARVDEPLGDEVILDEEAGHEAPDGDELLDEEPIAGTVLVVPGRPRYHVAGCRYLTGKSAAEVEVGDARDEGFSPCGVCKPDDVLAVADEPEPVEEYEEPAAEAEPETDEIVLEDVPGAHEIDVEEPEPEPEPVAAVAPTRRSRSTTSPRKAPAKRSPRPRKGSAVAVAEPAGGSAAAAGPTTDPVLEAVADDEPATASAAASAAAGPAAAADRAGATRRRTSNVVVIPDRGKFHRGECRYVRNAEGTSTMSRTQAARQGYDACGVCKP